MELRQLRQFYEVCETGSFSAAGASLYMTQQAVGKSMKQLEDELAVVLFTREKLGVSLTPQGEFLKERSKEILERVRDTEDQLRAIGANCPLQTRILVSEPIKHEITSMGEMNEAALTETPFIQCLTEAEADEKTLLENYCDAVILPSQIQHDKLLSYPLLHVPLCAIFSETEKIEKKEYSIRDFRNKVVILPENWIYMKRSLLQVLKEQNIEPKEVITIIDIDEGIRMAQEGGNVLILSEMRYAKHSHAGVRVRKMPIKKRGFSWNLYYVFRKNDTCQKETLRAYEFLKNRLPIVL